MIGGFTLSLNVLIPAVVIPGLLFTVLALYPFIEAYVTGDRREHHIAERPRVNPARTAVGVSILTGFLVLAIQQGFSARSAYADADAMASGGALLPGSDPARYHGLVDDGDAAKRNAYVSAGLAVAFGAAAGYLGWRSVDRPGPALAFRF